jgi:AraC-like DNA-binding protein
LRIAASHLANLLEFSNSLGIDNHCLESGFLSTHDPAKCSIEDSIPEAEYSFVLKQLITITNDPFLGLHYGCYMNIRAMGLIYNLSKSATDCEQVILFLKEFLENTFSVFELRIKYGKTDITIQLQCAIQDKTIKRHLLDASLSILYRELKLIANNRCNIQVCFPSTAIDEYKKMLGKDVKKDTGHLLIFNRDMLNNVLNPQNMSRLSELLPAYLSLIERTKNNIQFPAQVRKMVLNMCSPDLPGLQEVAGQFCMSQRSFQRKLTDSNTSFRKITDGVKRDLSKYLRKGNRLRTQEIALLLGYSESSAYLHAAKKWEVLV